MTAPSGWECAVCGATVDIAEPLPFRCPNSTTTDRHHVLRLCSRERSAHVGAHDVQESAGNPFVMYDRRLAWAAFAEAHGMTTPARHELVERLDAAIARVDGGGFRVTPFARSAGLSDELGFNPAGGVWVKDETHGVAGSHKARHLISTLLHLLAAESLGMLEQRPRLAIASCGNAALAAATLASAAEWPIDVFVPTWMGEAVGSRLDELGATIHRCERLASDPAGDPAMFRFREAVGRGRDPLHGPGSGECPVPRRRPDDRLGDDRSIERARHRARPGVRPGRRRCVRHVCRRRHRRFDELNAAACRAGCRLRPARPGMESCGPGSIVPSSTGTR